MPAETDPTGLTAVRHMLVPDGVYVRTASGSHFKPLTGPAPAELQALVQRLA
jgi:hypothetical protein